MPGRRTLGDQTKHVTQSPSSVFRQPISAHPKGINLGLSPCDVQLALIDQRLHRRRYVDNQIPGVLQRTTVIRLLDHET